jgi:hypothetical protein
MWADRMSIITAIVWVCLFHRTAARHEKRNAIPKFAFDPNTTTNCAWWLDNEETGSWTCKGVEDAFGVSLVDFVRWVSDLSSAT